MGASSHSTGMASILEQDKKSGLSHIRLRAEPTLSLLLRVVDSSCMRERYFPHVHRRRYARVLRERRFDRKQQITSVRFRPRAPRVAVWRRRALLALQIVVSSNSAQGSEFCEVYAMRKCLKYQYRLPRGLLRDVVPVSSTDVLRFQTKFTGRSARKKDC